MIGALASRSPFTSRVRSPAKASARSSPSQRVSRSRDAGPDAAARHRACDEHTVYPLIGALNNVPKVAVEPLFVSWLGAGSEPKIAIAFPIAVFAVIVDAVHGLRSMPKDVLDLGKVLKALRSISF